MQTVQMLAEQSRRLAVGSADDHLQCAFRVSGEVNGNLAEIFGRELDLHFLHTVLGGVLNQVSQLAVHLRLLGIHSPIVLRHLHRRGLHVLEHLGVCQLCALALGLFLLRLLCGTDFLQFASLGGFPGDLHRRVLLCRRLGPLCLRGLCRLHSHDLRSLLSRGLLHLHRHFHHRRGLLLDRSCLRLHHRDFRLGLRLYWDNRFQGLRHSLHCLRLHLDNFRAEHGQKYGVGVDLGFIHLLAVLLLYGGFRGGFTLCLLAVGRLVRRTGVLGFLPGIHAVLSGLIHQVLKGAGFILCAGTAGLRQARHALHLQQHIFCDIHCRQSPPYLSCAKQESSRVKGTRWGIADV